MAYLLDFDLKIQIISFCIYLMLCFSFVRTQRQKFRSTRLFMFLLMAVGINLALDVTTAITVNNLDSFSSMLNNILHKLFMISLVLIMFLLCLYVRSINEKRAKENKKTLIMQIVPIVLTIILSFIFNIDYVTTPYGNYSAGDIVKVIYACIIIYIFIIIVDLVKNRHNISSPRKNAVIVGLAIWTIGAIVQYRFPTILLSSFTIELMIVNIFFSFEDPKEYNDLEVNTFNRKAFHMMVIEKFIAEKKFIVFNITLDNIEVLQNRMGHIDTREFVSTIAAEIKSKSNCPVYRSKGAVLSLIFDSKSKCNPMEIAKSIQQMSYKPIEFKNHSIFIEIHIDFIECPKHCKNVDELGNLMNYLSDIPVPTIQKGIIRFIDEAYFSDMFKSMKIEEILSTAIDTKGIKMVYQPIYSTKEKKFVSAEALVRLKDNKTIGFISPEVFIPIAEKKGMIMELGEMIFRKVCSFIGRSGLENLGVHYVEVNVSGVQAIDSMLAKQIKSIMDEYHVKSEALNLEITETAAVESGDMLTTNIAKLKKIGCSFSMDDFGTGYSNLSKMAEMNYDLIKIDKSLIWPCFDENVDNEKPITLLENVIVMLHSLGLKIVAEGIETKEMVDWLTQRGVQYLQGYYFSKPISEEDYLAFLKENN